MKGILLIFLSVFQMSSLFSQPYLSIHGDSSTTWSLVKEGYCDQVCSAFYTPESDTIIDSNTYKILPDYGMIREDSTSGKVWFYNEVLNQEFLVMDLSLNISDTFTIYRWDGTPEVFVVDSINYNSGKKHVYLNASIFICGMQEPITFIEGTGPNAGFNYQRLVNSSYPPSYMLCHSKNNLQVEGNILFNDLCEVCSVGINELNSASKELIKVCDYLGRETPIKKNTPLLFYYSDGSIKKVQIVE